MLTIFKISVGLPLCFQCTPLIQYSALGFEPQDLSIVNYLLKPLDHDLSWINKSLQNYCLICNIRGMFNLDFFQVQQFLSLAWQQVNKMVDLDNAQYRRSGWLVLSIQPSNIFFEKNISILMTELHTFIFNHWSIFLQNWPF